MINTLDKKCKNILIDAQERGDLRHEIIQLYTASHKNFVLEDFEKEYPTLAELYLLLSLRN